MLAAPLFERYKLWLMTDGSDESALCVTHSRKWKEYSIIVGHLMDFALRQLLAYLADCSAACTGTVATSPFDPKYLASYIIQGYFMSHCFDSLLEPQRGVLAHHPTSIVAPLGAKFASS